MNDHAIFIKDQFAYFEVSDAFGKAMFYHGMFSGYGLMMCAELPYLFACL